MSFTIEHAIVLLDDGVSDGLGTVTLPASRWTEEQGIFASSDPSCRGQFEDQSLIHLGVELEVEVVQAPFCIAELRLLVATLQQSPTTASQFIGDECRDQVDRSHVFRLRMQQARFQNGGHAAQSQLMQRTIEFDQVHVF